MKHIKKFEELDRPTFIRDVNKLDYFGQTESDEMVFGILVGGVRAFPEAKFQKMSLFKSGQSWVIRSIFNSGNNTHRIDSVIDSKTGDIFWIDGNKFLDKESVMKFQKLVETASKTQYDFKPFFVENKLTTGDLKVVFGTFYS